MTLEEAIIKYEQGCSKKDVSVYIFGDGTGCIANEDHDVLFDITGGTDQAIQWLSQNSKPQWQLDMKSLIEHLEPIHEADRLLIEEWFKKNNNNAQTS